MELRQLHYFVAVAEELHFGRAARRVNISQPPLSMQIRNLEEELGVRLFTRTSRRVELTEAGRFFLNEVQGILGNIESAVETAREAASGSIGRLAVGFIGPAMDTFLPVSIRNFRRHNPGIILTLSELITSEQIESLYSGRIQVGFVRIYHHELKDLCSEIVWQEPYVLALPERHPFAAKRAIALSELKGQPMIMYPRSIQPSLYDNILKCCEMAGFKPKISQEARTKHTTTALVAAGLGVAIVPDSSKLLHRDGVVYLPITDSLPTVKIAMIWRASNDSPVLKRFLDNVKKCNRRNRLTTQPAKPD
jgi:DNA-binding transcriptional LysR family regulator